MNSHKLNEISIPMPSWVGVRPIYKKLSDDFQSLTSIFNIDIDTRIKIDLDHLIIAIDEIDFCIDELPSQEERDAITDSLLDFLSNNKVKWDHVIKIKGLDLKIENLKQVVQAINYKDDFIAAVKTIFINTEAKRHANNEEELIKFVILEGKATAILPLSIMGIKADTNFGTFFTTLCMLMGISDLVIDARKDFAAGLIVFKPTLKFYGNLMRIIVSEGVGLIFTIPKKWQFIKYCLSFSVALIKN